MPGPGRRPFYPRALALALMATLAAGFAVAGTATAAGPLPPVDVSVPAGQGPACGALDSRPGVAGIDVAANASGDTIVSWTRNNGAGTRMVQASFRPAGGSFGPPQDLGLTNPCYFLGIFGPTPDVALDAAGNSVIVFRGIGDVARAAIMPAGGVFGGAIDLSSDSSTWDPQVAMNAGGTAITVWGREIGADTRIQASTRQPGGTFGPAIDLTAGGADARDPHVAVNDAGAAAVAWTRSNGTVDIAQARVRPAGEGAFVAVQDLSATGPAGDHALEPDVALAPSGLATVVWERSIGSETRVQSRFLNPAGGIGAGIDDISEVGEHGARPALAVDASNTAVVVFDACPGGGGSCAVKSAVRLSGASFDTPDTISAPGNETTLGPRVAIDSAGVATAVFAPTGANAQVLLTRRPAGGTFGAVEPISPADGRTWHVSLATDDQGNVLTGWPFRSAAAGNPYAAQVSAFDAGAPTLTTVDVPSAGKSGKGVSMAAAASDRWSAPSLSWNFGDGGSATGDAVTHAFGSGGTFAVTVTATDAVGNASSATRSIVVEDACDAAKAKLKKAKKRLKKAKKALKAAKRTGKAGKIAKAKKRVKKAKKRVRKAKRAVRAACKG